MKKISLLIAFLGFVTVLNSQTLVLPSDGEGISSRTEKATFWIDPMVIQPSIYLSATDFDTRTDRKWWRTAQVSPLNYSAIEASITSHYASTEEDHWQVPQNANILTTDPFLIHLWQLRRSVTELGAELVSSP